jgi:O-succinylbenzoic acid--CoA ligase
VSDSAERGDPFSLRAAAVEAPDALALVALGPDGSREAYTFAALAREAIAIGEVIRSRLRDWSPGRSLSSDERLGPIAVRASNRAETALALYALMDAGIAFVLVHPRLTDVEALAIAQDAGTVGPILDDAALSAITREARSLTARESRTRSAIEPEQTLAILYTSGTSGAPKGAVLPRRAFVASAQGSERNLPFEPGDRWLLCLPLCHIGGLSVLTRCLFARRTAVLLSRFDPTAVCAAIEGERATIASFVPTMLDRLIEAPGARALSRLRAILLGGAAAPRALLERCAARALPVLATYGLTEACSQVTTQRPRDFTRVELGCGVALDTVSLAVRSNDGTLLCEPGVVGRVCVRGPTVFKGYHGQPARDATEWFDTGDFGALDEHGRLEIHARRTDLIVTGGENVYPLEVERALEGAPGVSACLVFGVDDARWGQVVAVAVIADATFDAAQFSSWCAGRLAAHKRPRSYVSVPALPTTSAGKPDRRAASLHLARDLRPLAR